MNNNDNHNQKFFCTSKRSMSLISAALVMIFFLTFMTGYVWGKRVALEDVLKAVEQKTFADQISGSLYALSASDLEVKKEEAAESEVVVLNTPVDEGVQDCSDSSEKNKGELVVALNTPPISQEKPEAVKEESSDQRYYAPLIGFGSKKAAEKFVGNLKNNPLQVVIKERTSTGLHGKKKVWYQVITQHYTNKEELEQLVAHVVKKERLGEVQIVAC